MSLKRRIEGDEAAIASLASKVARMDAQVANLPGGRKTRLRYVPRGQGFAFAPPQPVFNVNTAPVTRMDIAEGERQAAMSGYYMRPPPPIRNYPIPKRAPVRKYKSVAKAQRKRAINARYGFNPSAAQRAASKASLARARMSSKKGGSRPPKRVYMKSKKAADISIAKKMWSKQTKARLLQALKNKTKAVLVDLLARC